MSSVISKKDIRLLIALHENPMANYTTLAQKLDVSPTTISNRYHKIKNKSFNRVVADLNIEKMDLILVDVLVETESAEQSAQVEAFCDQHSFTLFRARIFGKFNGLFLEFRIPRGTIDLLSSQFEDLEDKKIIKSHQIVKKQYQTLRTKIEFQSWLGSHRWKFNWHDWNERLDEYLNNPTDLPVMRKKEFKPSILNKLDKLDMLILEELTKGCTRRKNKEIMESIEKTLPEESSHFPITKQTFSRRLKNLKEEVIQGYRLFFDSKTFDIHYSVLIICKSHTELTRGIYKLLKLVPIPFESNYMPLTSNSFMWYLRIPIEHFYHLYDMLWQYADELDVHLLNYKSTEHYGLWHKTFNEENHEWLLNY